MLSFAYKWKDKNIKVLSLPDFKVYNKDKTNDNPTHESPTHTNMLSTKISYIGNTKSVAIIDYSLPTLLSRLDNILRLELLLIL